MAAQALYQPAKCAIRPLRTLLVTSNRVPYAVFFRLLHAMPTRVTFLFGGIICPVKASFIW
ncbi:hypothetical protein D1K53_12840 [Salmonella enterica]|uniref:Uncharacterized protein n=2 Tax=Salmonella enterica subsp. arizonae serovar 18:z4,z23:- TaxID=1192839 RepID=A0A3S5YG59_SALER|nr:hypothetical protein LFZ50_18755 [Salmonella enterica subsp. arizonae serovar 53:-:- str. SA20100345]EAA5367148.1 hypothetical protein [Salmonella enterica subsp. arizonae]EAA9215880.1 hypothetical protein [Salmonella enterica]EAQ8018358.1 hypothetical protein [Salmonella enterica subsp. arizonae serovar 13,23:gz51:-]EBV8286932.1 hypothetical protein [Salmonella enterica subsp. arizonae serovar 18:z4,z23:-]ECU0369412.1 hypothetical protein [Salmonella enterica subsp. enterica serovar Newpor